MYTFVLRIYDFYVLSWKCVIIIGQIFLEWIQPLKLNRCSLMLKDKKKKKKKGKKDKDEDDKDDDEDEKPKDVSFARIMKMNAPEWMFIVGGCLAAIVNGGVQPAFAVIFAEILGVCTLNKYFIHIGPEICVYFIQCFMKRVVCLFI